MTIADIISAVRWCIDEEAVNASNLEVEDPSNYDYDVSDHILMDNIIKSKIGDALRWVCLYAPSELLTGSDTSGGDTGIVYEGTITTRDPITDESAGVVDGAPSSVTYNRFVLPSNFIKLVRVRGTSWHRSVSGESLLKEDSEEYLQLHDPTCAYATADRPQAALINKKRKELECWPASGTFEFTCIVSPASVNIVPSVQPTDTVDVPPLVRSAFIYYLAFLLLSAYGDARAVRMLEIAKMNIGRNG